MKWEEIHIREDFKATDLVEAMRLLADEVVEENADGTGYDRYVGMETPMCLLLVLSEFTDADLTEFTEDGHVDAYALWWSYEHLTTEQLDGMKALDDLIDHARWLLGDFCEERMRKLDAQMGVGVQIKRIADKLTSLDGKDMSVLRRVLTDLMIQQKKAEDAPAAPKKSGVVDMSAFKPKKGKNE